MAVDISPSALRRSAKTGLGQSHCDIFKAPFETAEGLV
jgi:hypothetical protein